jgi:hypothetical protein
MFKNEDCAVSIREAMLNIRILLYRCVDKVLVDHCSDQEKRLFETKFDKLISIIEKEILNDIYAEHPNLKISEQ